MMSSSLDVECKIPSPSFAIFPAITGNYLKNLLEEKNKSNKDIKAIQKLKKFIEKLPDKNKPFTPAESLSLIHIIATYEADENDPENNKIFAELIRFIDIRIITCINAYKNKHIDVKCFTLMCQHPQYALDILLALDALDLIKAELFARNKDITGVNIEKYRHEIYQHPELATVIVNAIKNMDRLEFLADFSEKIHSDKILAVFIELQRANIQAIESVKTSLQSDSKSTEILCEAIQLLATAQLLNQTILDTLCKTPKDALQLAEAYVKKDKQPNSSPKLGLKLFDAKDIKKAETKAQSSIFDLSRWFSFDCG